MSKELDQKNGLCEQTLNVNSPQFKSLSIVFRAPFSAAWSIEF